MRDSKPTSKLRASVLSLTMSSVGLTLLGITQFLKAHPVVGWLLIAVAISAAATAIVKVVKSRHSSS